MKTRQPRCRYIPPVHLNKYHHAVSRSQQQKLEISGKFLGNSNYRLDYSKIIVYYPEIFLVTEGPRRLLTWPGPDFRAGAKLMTITAKT